MMQQNIKQVKGSDFAQASTIYQHRNNQSERKQLNHYKNMEDTNESGDLDYFNPIDKKRLSIN